jgi:thiol-disulfide isomerase/thioredoxin/outer membrane murein-binding lipoprotein Lpp
MTLVSALLVLAAAFVVGCGPSSAGPTEDLEKQVQTLTQRVEALERQLQTMKSSGAQPQGDPQAEAEAQTAMNRINTMVAGGQVDAAKAELVEFQKKYGSTRIGGQAQRLAQELAVVGKTTPPDWGIEKWFQGQKEFDLTAKTTTVLVFWEVWCPHCKREVPRLQQLYETYKGQGLNLVGLTKVNRSATEDAVTAFISENKLSYPMAKENGSMSSYFNVSGVPAAAVLKDGKVVWRGHPVKITDEMLKGWLASS